MGGGDLEIDVRNSTGCSTSLVSFQAAYLKLVMGIIERGGYGMMVLLKGDGREVAGI